MSARKDVRCQRLQKIIIGYMWSFDFIWHANVILNGVYSRWRCEHKQQLAPANRGNSILISAFRQSNFTQPPFHCFGVHQNNTKKKPGGYRFPASVQNRGWLCCFCFLQVPREYKNDLVTSVSVPIGNLKLVQKQKTKTCVNL